MSAGLRAWQVEPQDDDLFWLCGVGRDRGTGKTFAGALAASTRIQAGFKVLCLGQNREHLMEMVHGNSGLSKFIRDKPSRMSKEEIIWPNGGLAMLRTIDQALERRPVDSMAAVWGDDLVDWGTPIRTYERIRELLYGLSRFVVDSDVPKIILSGEMACPIFSVGQHDHLPPGFAERLAANRPR
jgi:phage terminase large subunit-like protein